MSVDKDLYERIEKLKTCQNTEYLKKLEGQGKMFVRERLKYLLDPESEFEDGLFARCLEEGLPCDAVVTVVGKINGRTVCVMANDMTVKAGTWGVKTIEKIMRIQETAIRLKVPMIYLIDSAGARLNEQFETFLDRRHAGKIFYNQTQMSGVVPQICAVFGPSPAGSAYLPALSDVVIMVDKNTSVYLGSPRMAEMVTQEKVTQEEMGGAMMHCSVSGLGDVLVDNEFQAMDAVKQYLDYMPQSWEETVPAKASKEAAAGRPIEEIVPADQRLPFEMNEFINRVVDEDSFYEFKKLYAPELITAFARLDGQTIGIVANNSNVKGGVIFPESSEKGSHFIGLCGSFNIPLLFLMDIAGFMIGSKVEREAIARRGARWLMALGDTNVTRISVMVRKAYGAGYVAMSGASFQADACIGLAQAQPAVMGPEAAVNAMYLNKINEIEDPKERARYIYKQRQEYMKDINVWRPASELYIDDVVPGDRLRSDLIKRFAVYNASKDPKARRINRRNPVCR